MEVEIVLELCAYNYHTMRCLAARLNNEKSIVSLSKETDLSGKTHSKCNQMHFSVFSNGGLANIGNSR